MHGMYAYKAMAVTFRRGQRARKK